MDTLLENQVVTQEHIDKAYSYAEYRNLIDNLIEEDKTTGPKQSEALLGYTKLNVVRMNRWDKTGKITDEMKNLLDQIKEPMIWLVLTEGWCGDAAHIVPILAKLAELSPNIEIKFLLRDDNLEVMDKYLTNGGRSIPKLVAFKADTLEELGTWGPRPEPVQEYVLSHKGAPYQELMETTQKMYSKDKAQSIQQELVELIKGWI